MRFESDLTTIEAVGRQLLKTNPGAIITPATPQYADFYDFMKDIVPEVSDFIAGYCGFSFVPYKEDKFLSFQQIAMNQAYDPRERLLWLPDDMMIPASATWNGTLLSITDYQMYPYDSFSTWALLLTDSASVSWGQDNDGVTIGGVWGYHLNATQPWTTIETVTLASDTTTSVTVAASSAYEVRQYLRIENELMQITGKPDTTHLTVLRGVNGHTAAAHTAKALQTYTPVRGIRMAATRMAAYLYQKRLDVGGAVQIGDAAFLLDSLPAVVKDAMNQRRKWTFGHV